MITFDDKDVDQLGSQLLAQLSAEDLNLILRFCKTLLDDYKSNSASDLKNAEVQATLISNLPYFLKIAQISFIGVEGAGGVNSSDNKVVELLLQCLETTSTWINHFLKYTEAEAQLKHFVPWFLTHLEASFSLQDDSIFKEICDMVVEMFRYNQNVWDRSTRERLYQFTFSVSPTILPPLLTLTEGLDDRNISYCRLVISIAEFLTPKYLQDPDNNGSFKQLLELLIAFSSIQPTPMVEDTMAMEILEFWNGFVEEIVGGGYLSSEQPQTGYINQIIGIYWNRIMLPPDNITNTWEKDTWQEFLSFRRDFCDFLELAYPIVSSKLFGLLVNSIVENIQQSHKTDGTRDPSSMNWRQIECSLYCLNGLSEMIGTSGDEYSTVQLVFNSSLWEDLSSCNSLRVRQTAVSLIGSFDTFFERPEGQPYLTTTLSYLFKSLSIPDLSLTASRSIQKLCASSRKHLVSLLPTLMDLYCSRQYYKTTGTVAHERTVNAIACVIQALDNLEEKAQYADRLVSILVEQLPVTIENKSQLTDPEVMLLVVSLLKCIVNIGKGLRIPEETASPNREELQSLATFWNTYSSSTREKIVGTIQWLTMDAIPFSQDPQICEVCCDIFKSGFSEIVPNPFVFDPDTILTFISAKHQYGPPTCYTTLIELSSCLVTSSSVGESTLATEYISELLQTFFSSTHENDYEPDIQIGNMQLLTQIYSHYPDSFLSNQSALPFLIGFATEMLASNDRFVIRATSKFWTTVITKDNARNETSRTRRSEILHSAGPLIVDKVVGKISGEAIRSDLECYTDVIKKLVNKYPLESKPWFVNSIINNPRPDLAKQDLSLRTRFLTKIFNLRGSRETNEVVKNFWSDCKGIANYT
ncbi:Kap122p [Sugiyamaella lignohabitans]|uniref:Kap122p n=1 Tax=Sugiyamaella lignohabitans TaxID=796027 RepID=A0A167C4C0_9ASCO|nr:Kap122p [Sugiyamaella lignohabitans]ANB11199.1 Kap122p [Sugiyamaella lignohabitans]